MTGERVLVQQPLSWEGFQQGLQGSLDKELVLFVLHTIERGAAGTAKNLLSKDPFRCRNSQMSQWEVQVLQEEVAQGLCAHHRIGPFPEPPFARFRCSPVSIPVSVASLHSYLPLTQTILNYSPF